MDVVSRELRGDRWEVDVGDTQSKPVYPIHPMQVRLLCENLLGLLNSLVGRLKLWQSFSD